MAYRRKQLNPKDIYAELYADSNSDMESSSSDNETYSDEEREVTPTGTEQPSCSEAQRRPFPVSFFVISLHFRLRLTKRRK